MKNEVKPKFDVGDEVRVVSEPMRITHYWWSPDQQKYFYSMSGGKRHRREDELEKTSSKSKPMSVTGVNLMRDNRLPGSMRETQYD